MIGKVDDSNRAMLGVDVRAKFRSEPTIVRAWVDTAFEGHFVFLSKLIEELELDTLVETAAILADGTKVTLETSCNFGQSHRVCPPGRDRDRRAFSRRVVALS